MSHQYLNVGAQQALKPQKIKPTCITSVTIQNHNTSLDDIKSLIEIKMRALASHLNPLIASH